MQHHLKNSCMKTSTTCMWNEEFVSTQTDSSCRLLPSPRVALSFSQPFPSAGTSCRSAAASAHTRLEETRGSLAVPSRGQSSGRILESQSCPLPEWLFSAQPQHAELSDVWSLFAIPMHSARPISSLGFSALWSTARSKERLYKITLAAFCSRRQVLQYFLKKDKGYLLSSLSNPMHIPWCPD